MVIGSAARLTIAALLLAVAGCVGAPPPPAPPPRPVATSTPPRAAALAPDWQDWPVTPGEWRYEQDARGSRALYSRPGEDARAVLGCDRAPARVTLSRAGVAAALTVRTTSVTRALSAGPSSGTLPYVMAVLAPTDPLLDAIAFSRGRFTLEAPGSTPLVLPPWAEIGRVIEDCRG